MGSFHFKAAPNVQGLPKSYSVSADGSPSYLTPSQMGRQELYQQVPFAAVFGLQKRERLVSEAFASYAAELDIKCVQRFEFGSLDFYSFLKSFCLRNAGTTKG